MDVSKTHVESDFKHERPLMSCRFDPSGRFCFAGSQDYQVWRWTLDDGKTVDALMQHESARVAQLQRQLGQLRECR